MINGSEQGRGIVDGQDSEVKQQLKFKYSVDEILQLPVTKEVGKYYRPPIGISMHKKADEIYADDYSTHFAQLYPSFYQQWNSTNDRPHWLRDGFYHMLTNDEKEGLDFNVAGLLAKEYGVEDTLSFLTTESFDERMIASYVRGLLGESESEQQMRTEEVANCELILPVIHEWSDRVKRYFLIQSATLSLYRHEESTNWINFVPLVDELNTDEHLITLIKKHKKEIQGFKEVLTETVDE